MNKSKKQAGIRPYSYSHYENDWLTGVSPPQHLGSTPCIASLRDVKNGGVSEGILILGRFHPNATVPILLLTILI
jgi:hypothetical protein